jgi:hypothetical protein
VKEAHCISDEPEWVMYKDDTCFQDRVHAEVLNAHRAKPVASVVYKDVIERYHDAFDPSTITWINELYEWTERHHLHIRKEKKIYYAVASMYVAYIMVGKSSLKPSDMCVMFGTPFTHDFWSAYNTIKGHLRDFKPTIHEQLQVLQSNQLYYRDIRTNVHRLDCIYTPLKCNVIRVAQDLFTKVHKNMISACKPDKLTISVVWVACKALKMCVPVQEFTTRFDVSKSTLETHERMIQGILQCRDKTAS